MNPIPIIGFIAGAGIVSSVAAFIWACITRQFTGYDFGNLPLQSHDGDVDVVEVPAGVDKSGVLSMRLRAAILVGAMVMVFGLIGWSIYLVIVVSNGARVG